MAEEFDVWEFWEKVKQAKTTEDFCNRWIEFKKLTKGKCLDAEEFAVKLFLKSRARFGPDPDGGNKELRRRRLKKSKERRKT